MIDIVKRLMNGLTMTTVIASPKCQVVIPKNEREKIGLKPGSRVVVEAVGDHIEIRPVPEDPVGFYRGTPERTKSGPPP
jgi:AbrB family looped-hinge helix DNA binding protein